MLLTGRPGNRVALALACVLLSGCGVAEFIPGMSSYVTAPSGGKTTLLTFETPSMPFENAAKGEAAGFAAGTWTVADGKLQQTMGATDNLANHMKYTGDAFSTKDGRAGKVYTVSVDASVAKDAESPAVHGYPTGVMALMPYYKDPKNYILLSATANSLQGWVVSGQTPAGAEWSQDNKFFDQYLDTPLTASGSLNWKADINTESNEITVYVNDQKKLTKKIPMINHDPHWVALGANGNYAQFDNFKIVWKK